MRDYATLHPSFWTGETGRKLHGNPEAQVLAAYLVTCRHGNLIGLYYLPLVYISTDTGMGIDRVSSALEKLCSDGVNFARYDHASQHVWVITMAPRQTTRSPKAVSGARKALAQVPTGPLRSAFEELYGSDLSRLHTVSVPYPAQEIPHAPELPRSGTRTETGTRPSAPAAPVVSDPTYAAPSVSSGAHFECDIGWRMAFDESGAKRAMPQLYGQPQRAAVAHAVAVAKLHGKGLQETAHAIAKAAKPGSPHWTLDLAKVDPYAAPARDVTKGFVSSSPESAFTKPTNLDQLFGTRASLGLEDPQ